MFSRLFVGIDAGCYEHVIVIMSENQEVLTVIRVSNNYDGWKRLLETIRSYATPDCEVWVAGEGSGGYLSPFDQKVAVEGFKYVAFHVEQVRNFRALKHVQQDKDDQRDAMLIAEMLIYLYQQDDLQNTPQQEEYFKGLRSVGRALEEAVTDKSMVQKQFVAVLRAYWPELVTTDNPFSSTDAKGLLVILSKYPTPQAVRSAGVKRIVGLLKRSKCCSRQAVVEDLVEQARRISSEVVGTEMASQIVAWKAEKLLLAIEEVQKLEKYLEEKLREHPYGRWLLDQEGIGVRTASCFLGEAQNLDRFSAEAKLARYAGNGAVQSQSGTSSVRQYDGHRYNHHLKRAIMLMARSRSLHHAESKAYLSKRREQGDRYWAAVKKLARYLLRFLWNSWFEVMGKRKSDPEGWSQKDALAA